MKKRIATRQAILDQAHNLSSLMGVEALTIGGLAERAKMSKSGLFGHFGSKEQLQIAVIGDVAQQFQHHVIYPARTAGNALERLRASVVLWLDWSTSAANPGGCPLAAAAFEFDANEGPVRLKLVNTYQRWWDYLAQLIHSASKSDMQRQQVDSVVAQIFGIYFAFHISHWLLRHKDADKIALLSLDSILAGFSSEMS